MDISELKQAEQRIQQSLQEKEIVLKEIHHRIKNNLQVVASLLYLQAESVDDERVRGLLEESQNRVKTLALIHEQLYQSPSLVRIDFARYARNLTAYLFDAYMISPDAIRLVIDIADAMLEVDTATPCSLIINELLANALKHAFPGGASGQPGHQPQVCIGFHEVASDEYELVVSDNGVGLPDGFDYQHPSSLGMQIVEVLTKQLKGRLELQQEGGTTFRITFPRFRAKRFQTATIL